MVNPPVSSDDGDDERRLSLRACGMTLGVFLAITYSVCVLWCLAFPAYDMHRGWEMYFPGFVWLSWPGYFLGLVESFLYGWYVALVYVPLRNFFHRRYG